jgi:hypothetical protein
MSDKVTQTDNDNLADILCWIKGFRACAEAAGIGMDICPFQTRHEESIRKVRLMVRDNLKNEEEDPDFREVSE